LVKIAWTTGFLPWRRFYMHRQNTLFSRSDSFLNRFFFKVF